MVKQMPKGTDENYEVKVDTASDTITYIGKAVRKSGGNVVTNAVWQIKRIDTGTLAADISWADGSDDFDKIWNSRAGYSY